MYYITEVKGKIDKNNHKAIISPLVDRITHSFESLKDLAYFSREHNIFTSFQKEITEVPRTNEAGRELYIGNNLLWLDLDFTVNLVELKKKLSKLDLTSFAYYSSSYYTNAKAHARLCIICEEQLDIDNWDQILFFANQILNKLELKQVEVLDKSIYNLSSYLAMVKGDYSKEDLIIVKGKPFRWIKQEKIASKLKNLPEERQKEVLDQACFGETGDLAFFLDDLNSISGAEARNNNTVSLSFTDIPEKTRLGYYIYLNNPWFVHHRSKDTKYLSSFLTEEEFILFKKFYFKSNFKNLSSFKRTTIFNKIIEKQYLDSNIFDNEEKLLFVESPTGTGKTTSIAEWMLTQTDKSVLFISVNRMQAVTTYKSLKKRINFTCYLKATEQEYLDEKLERKRKNIYNTTFQENAAKGIIPDRLICNILSLHHLSDDFGNLKKKFDYIIIDEISTLPNSVSNSVGLISERIGAFELGLKIFKKLLFSSEKVICMDGFISNSVVKLVSDLSKKEPYIIRNTIPTNKKVEIFVCSGGQPKFEGKGTCKKYLGDIVKDIKKANYVSNQRLMVVALSSLELSKSLEQYLKKSFPDKKIEVFNSEFTNTNGPEIVKIFEDLDKYMEENKIDILIYSPTITTGVDIPQAKNTNVYHIMSGNPLTSHTNYQMTMRGRNAKTYKVLISKSLLIPKTSFTSFEEFLDDTLDNIHERLVFKSKKLTIKNKVKNSGITTSGMFLIYDRLEYFLTAEEWNKVVDKKSMIKALKFISEKHSYDLEGVKVGFKIDKAFIDFQIELFKNKCNSDYKQYLNFLKHEECKISIEEDIDYNSKNYYGKYKNNPQKYIDSYKEEYTEKLKELNCWKEEYKKLKHIRLFEILKVAKVFYILREKIRIGKYANEELLELYDTLYKKSFLKEYKTFREFLDKNTDKEKISKIKSILSVVFNAENIERNGIILKY